MIKTHNDLKPLSANLKRLNVGKSFVFKDFDHLMEENNLDEIWIYCKKEWSENNVQSFLAPSYDKHTQSFINALNYAYVYYENQKEERFKKNFNKLLKLGLIHFFKNNGETKDIEKILEILKELKIVSPETIVEIEKGAVEKFAESVTISQNPTYKMNSIKKYQVFVSSTYTDLKEERQAAVEAILRKGHIPAGMELFAANDKSQWEVIKKWIDDSDIYMLILGGRYGSIDKETGLSYTEMEYNYAVQKNKPLFALVLHNKIIDNKPVEIIKEYDLKDEKYKAFRDNVTSKMCSFPESLDQIKLNTNHSLDDLIRDNDKSLIGWIRGDINIESEKKKF